MNAPETPKPSDRYGTVMWACFAGFLAGVFATAAAALFMWGLEFFGALLVLTLGLGVGTLFAKDVFFTARMEEHTPTLVAPDPRQDLFGG